VRPFITIGAVAAIGTIVAWTTAIPKSPIAELTITAGGAAPAALDTMALGASAMRLRLRDPFRLDRKPTDVRYNPWEPVATVAPPPPAPVRPPLALAGLLGGPPWNALIEGIPGRENGVLLQLGDSMNGVRFVALRGDTVLLAAFDTTWSLTARRPWH
jgi:hypothetical protein